MRILKYGIAICGAMVLAGLLLSPKGFGCSYNRLGSTYARWGR